MPLINILKIMKVFLLIGDFNAEDTDPCLSEFLYEHNAENIVKDKTCFKILSNPSSIDLFLTNFPPSFENTCTVTAGLSDFHKMVITVTKMTFHKNPTKEIYYRDYKKFDQDLFREELAEKLYGCDSCYYTFEKTFINFLNKHAPLKKKFLRANHAPYMNKTLRKDIMSRSQLQTKYFKNKSQNDYLAFKKQRNFCSKLYKKERKNYYNSLDIKNIADNKQFWKTIKPFLSEKIKTTSKIKLKDQDKIISNDDKVAEEFSIFFENAVKFLIIRRYNKFKQSC